MVLNRFFFNYFNSLTVSKYTFVYFKYNFFNLVRLHGAYSYLTRLCYHLLLMI